jgi:hypothetical protein
MELCKYPRPEDKLDTNFIQVPFSVSGEPIYPYSGPASHNAKIPYTSQRFATFSYC